MFTGELGYIASHIGRCALAVHVLKRTCRLKRNPTLTGNSLKESVMKCIKYGLLVVCANFALTAHAFAPVEPDTQVLAQNSLTTGSAPTDNTIRRINPNSRQGTTSSVPPVRGPSTLPIQPTPSLENGQIRNGYSRPTTPPPTLKPTAPSLQPRDKR